MYRIVHNDRSGRYRVEKHGLLGWSFVTDSQTGDYLDFADLEGARDWICTKSPETGSQRRWRVVSDCSA